MKTKLFSYLLTLTLVGLAAWAAGSLYYRYLQDSLDTRWPGPRQHRRNRPAGLRPDRSRGGPR